MTPRAEARVFVAAAVGLWLLFFVQAVNTPICLDDWFPLVYWRDHELSFGSLWAHARHNYFNYNPRLGDVLLALLHGSEVIHLVLTPLVQLAVLPTVFVIAYARWPRANLRDLSLLLFLQAMIWLVIPVPGIIYFYRPITTNYLWAFTITLALFVPYRLALAGASSQRRVWLVPIMLVLGWMAGMGNEHVGPTAMVAMAILVYLAWRQRRLRAWMVAGMLGLYIGYPMLFFAPGQSVRYGGIATRETPAKLLADRGVIGCLEILRDFVFESRLAILVFGAVVIRYLFTLAARGARYVPPPRRTIIEASVLVTAAAAIVVTLFASPMTTDRVLYASGVLLVAALALGAQHLFQERVVRHFTVGACMIVFAFHVVRFVDVYAGYKAENDARIAMLESAQPGTLAVVPSYKRAERSRWHFGDDFQQHPWLLDYVGSELFDLAGIHLDRERGWTAPIVVTMPSYDPPRIAWSHLAQVPTYRQLQMPVGRFVLASQIGAELHNGLTRFAVRALGVLEDARRRPVLLIEWTPHGYTFVDGRPYDDERGHFVRVRAATLPRRIEAAYVVGCSIVYEVEPIVEADGDALLAVDERLCRGPFTAILCESSRCWISGWY